MTPSGFDVNRPAPARRYDVLLGGKDNFAPDRSSAEQIREELPSVDRAARELRAFLHRAVDFLAADCGVRQFLDIGCGMPYKPNVHEIAQTVHPDAHVAYVDPDLLVTVHARALMFSDPLGAVSVTEGGLDDIDAVLNAPTVRELIDFDQPVAVLLLAVLHFVVDDQHAQRALARIIDALPPGSYLALSHVTFDPLTPEHVERLTKLAEPGAGHGPFRPRTHAQITALLDGLELLPPGLVSVVDWCPDRQPQPQITEEEAVAYGVIARKPTTP
uniref:SAM-dependent methyltransferase n=1 Tax=Paractinoplanes polyasparticus TaxID=2856853 RepID=UPI001C847166|nr:SAM-dependent methyltransferase [Actinoplanes polyasparticus]